jgi:hypothetical protein
MHVRSADFTIIYGTPERTPECPAIGQATIVEREHDAYYRWSIHDGMRQLAARSGRCVFPPQLLPDQRLPYAIPRLIQSIHRSRRWKPYRFRVTDWSWRTPPHDDAALQQLLGMLERLRTRTGMYIGQPNVEALIHFLHGFRAGCYVAGLAIEYTPESAYHTILQARGWTFSAGLPIEEMRNSGLSGTAIIDELITLEMAAWRATYGLE